MNREPRYRLTYHGNGCGGCNLPFENLKDAIAYAKEGHATDFTVRQGNGITVVAAGVRRDRRYKWEVTIL